MINKLKNYTILVPIYQNEKNIKPLEKKLKYFIDRGIKILFIDDGSYDRSIEKLVELKKKYNKQISIISLNRNYGQYKVINFGLKKIKTEYTIILSCDLQDDVRLINKMINASKQNDLIVSERHIRNDGLLNKFFGRLYWGMIKKISINDFPQGGFDFCCLNNGIRKKIINTSDNSLNIFVDLFLVSKNPKILKGTRTLREIGSSKWSIKKKTEMALSSFIIYSNIGSFLGLAISLISILISFGLGIYFLSQYFFFGSDVPGFYSLILTILFFASISLFMQCLNNYAIQYLIDKSSIINNIIEKKKY